MPTAPREAPKALAKLEDAIARERGNDGPYFNGDRLCLVDAAYAPFLQRFCMVDARLGSRLLDGFPKVKAWAEALLATDMVTGSVHASFAQEFAGNLKRRGFWVAGLFEARAAE